MRNFTPMMKQYFEIKKKHPEALLLFRCGDFYTSFEDDASDASKILGITLIKRSDGSRIATFPHYDIDSYLPRLIRAGRKVAICDQLVDPKTVKKERRSITELVQPNKNNQS